MKTTELRIGNYVLAPSYDNPEKHEIGQIIYINGFDIVCVKNENQGFETKINSVLINPIPITEEWMMKFGFKKTKEHPARSIWENDFDIFWLSKGYGIMFYASTTRLRECKFVHQFQNLYFALSGEELTIMHKSY